MDERSLSLLAGPSPSARRVRQALCLIPLLSVAHLALGGVIVPSRDALTRAAITEGESGTISDENQKRLQQAAAEFERGRTAEALRELELFSRHAAEAPPARVILARFHLAAGQTQPARALLEEAARGTPGYAARMSHSDGWP